MPTGGTLTVILTPTASYRLHKISYSIAEIQIQIHVIHKTAVSLNQIILHNKAITYQDKSSSHIAGSIRRWFENIWSMWNYEAKSNTRTYINA